MPFNAKIAGKWVLNALLPRTCAHCAVDLHYLETRPLCAGCSGELEALPELHCEICGLPLADGGQACYDCRGAGGGRALDIARAALIFNPVLRSVVHGFKYRAREDLAGFIFKSRSPSCGLAVECGDGAASAAGPSAPDMSSL